MRDLDRAEPEDFDEIEPMTYLHTMQGIPRDAQQMGLDRNTEEGALIAMAGSLSSAKPAHRLIAWLLLIGMVVPLLITLAHEFF